MSLPDDPDPVATAARLADALERMTTALAELSGGDRVLAEAVSQEYEARLLAAHLGPDLLDSFPVALVVVDGDGVIVLFNTAAERLTGWPRTEVRGKHVELLLPENLRRHHAGRHRPEFMSDMRIRTMGQGLDLRLRHRFGSLIPVDIGLGPSVTDRGIYVFVAIRRRTDLEASPVIAAGELLPPPD